MEYRKVIRTNCKNEYNDCSKYLINKKYKQSGGYVSFNKIREDHNFGNDIIYIIINDNKKTFYVRPEQMLDNIESNYEETISVHYIFINYFILLRKDKLKKISNRFRKVSKNDTFIK